MKPEVSLSFWMILARVVQGAQICPSGQYLFNGVCELCPGNCSMCHSASICSECKAGYYGESCVVMCNPNCHENVCDKSTGVCISCSEGYFKDANKNCLSCPSNCSRCSSDTLCTACKIGFRGRWCQEVCINCKPGTACDQWTGQCNVCKQGLTGSACNETCDSKCSMCQRLHGDMCIACSNEKYGETCEIDCSARCVNKTCDDVGGNCTHGCQVGCWGAFCENKCMAGCNSSICDRQNGSCLLHNSGGDMGTERNCPNNCSCDAEGICRECDPESEFMCGNHCSRGCRNQICFRNSSCLLVEEDLNTQPSKRSAGSIILYLAAGLAVVLVTFIFCYIYYRFRIRRALCCRSLTTGNNSEDRCWKLLCPSEKTRPEVYLRASSNDADTPIEKVPL